MVAIINSGTSIRSTFFYNENKVDEGVAVCIMAENYPLDIEQMQQAHRLKVLEKIAEGNEKVSRNSVHISLNFAPEENHSVGKLKQIASEYMDRIGFGEQPFLVYQHFDSGHPHIHIVSTKVRYDGTCIDMQNIGKNQSEHARRAIEVKYGLVKAEDHKASLFRMQPVDVTKIEYGKQATKRAISNVLSAVIDKYKYTSLAELNAVLGLYNVIAERGSKASRTYRSGGLVFRILDKEGNGISAPIKASAFFSKPTLKNLEAKYLRNDMERQSYKSKLKSTIDFIIKAKNVRSLKALSVALSKQQIRLIERVNQDGRLYGLTYIDLKNKVVFNGSAIGKEYSAAGIMELFGNNKTLIDTIQNEGIKVLDKKSKNATQQEEKDTSDKPNAVASVNDNSIFDDILQVENGNEFLPFPLRSNKKKRKKRRNKNLNS